MLLIFFSYVAEISLIVHCGPKLLSVKIIEVAEPKLKNQFAIPIL